MVDTSEENARFDIYSSLLKRFGTDRVKIAESELHRRNRLL